MVVVGSTSDEGDPVMSDEFRNDGPQGAGGTLGEDARPDPETGMGVASHDPVPEGASGAGSSDLAQAEATPGSGPASAEAAPDSEMLPKGDALDSELKPAEGKKKKKKKKKGKKKDEPKTGSARGVETMFRTSYRTHQDLSNLADNKANIMISINGIIISILLASISDQIIANRLLLLPTAVLLVGCLLSLVYAVLAARPRVTQRKTTMEEVRRGKTNILFFGTFTSLEEDEFVEGMQELIRDPKRTYENMTRDIYGLGSVLATKYQLLRISYTIFMVGLVAGVLLFLIAFTWASGGGVGI
jgi:hypothetical protein